MWLVDRQILWQVLTLPYFTFKKMKIVFISLYLLLLWVAYLLLNINVRTFVILLNTNIRMFIKIVIKQNFLIALTGIKTTQWLVNSIWNIFKWIFQSKTPRIFHILKSVYESAWIENGAEIQTFIVAIKMPRRPSRNRTEPTPTSVPPPAGFCVTVSLNSAFTRLPR